MIKQLLFFSILLFALQPVFAQIPDGYYNDATGTGYILKTQLYHIIKDHTSVSYTPGVWDAFYTTDVRLDGFVWDMYSDVPGGNAAYNYTFGTDQCGNYSGEGSCYNREHSFPKSWFNDAAPMYTDLFHLYPTDGYVNGKRGNYPFGEVGTINWESTNGSKLGTCNYPGYAGTVFEPIDEYKGDFARTYFYMVTRYENIITSWPGSDMLDGSSDKCFADWAIEMLMNWHNDDKVSEKELNRNKAVYEIQGNRNPFIDHPDFVARIWGVGENVLPSISNVELTPENPTSVDAVSISAIITDADGNIVNAELHWGLSPGNLSDTIIMNYSSSDIYLSVSEIPAQADGIEVYFEIEAEDNEGGITISNENNYEVSEANAVNELKICGLKMFPNPASNGVNIFIPAFAGKINFKIYDALGILIMEESQDIINEECKLNLNGIKSGIYFINILTESGTSTKKLMINL